MTDQERVERGRQAKEITESPLWAEAWAAYRDKCLALIEDTDSANVERVMQAKRLLTAGKAAQAHLTALVTEGKIAAAQIKLDEERKPKLFDRLRAAI